MIMKVKTITLNKSVFEGNDREAAALREYLCGEGVFLVNVMSSPGAGKTTTLVQLVNNLKANFRIGVLEADIDSDVDAVRVAAATGVKSVQLHTGGMCHLDAAMTKQGLDELDISDLDVVFLENVGNLVCPAEFDTGAHLNMMILSVPEGDDKPLKYPLVFERSQLVLINKIDTLPYFGNFDIDRCHKNIAFRNKDAVVCDISAKTGEGIDAVAEFLKNKAANNKM